MKLLMLVGLLCGMANLHGQSNAIRAKVVIPQSRPPLLGRVQSYEGKQASSQLQATDVYAIAYPLDWQANTQPTPNAVITQKAETFIPNVLVVTPMTVVYFLNEDQEYHNVFSRTPGLSFNIGRRPPGHMYPQRIDRPGVVKLFCDIHAHMRAYILCVETPYFTRLNPDGSFFLGNLPDGRYRLELLHPRLRTFVSNIQLSGGQTINRTIEMTR